VKGILRAQGEQPYVPMELYRSAMVRTWGLLWWAVFAVFFRKLKLAEPSGERVRQASNKGPVVYVMRTRSLVDYLALNEVLRRRRLPLAEYGTGVSMTAWMPTFEGIKTLWRKAIWFARNGRLPHPVGVGWLSKMVAEGGNAAVFLRPDARWSDFFAPPDWPDPVTALLEAQDVGQRRVQLLPVVVVWQRHPERAQKSTLRWLLGSEDQRGTFLKLLGVARGHRRALVQIGEPVDAQEFLDRYPDEPRPRQAKRLRLVLRRYCWREAQLVRGPALKSPSWTRELVLKTSRINQLVADESAATGRSRAEVQQLVLKAYDTIAARISYAWVGVAASLLRFLWNNIFQGVEVRPEDVERIRAAQREGVAVLVPNHRSHLDYVLLSSVLHEHDVNLPHVIAGENLSFFPLGAVFRKYGAIFIKRSFRGDRVFPAVLRSYLAHLFREGYTVEFFIEGGRSRTGKTLPAKLGILGYTVDAGVEARMGRQMGEVSWLPVAITYEQVAEEGPYARELDGADKTPESVGGVVRAFRVLFKKFGRVYLRVGEPVLLSEQIDGAGWGQLDRDERFEQLQHLGEELVHRIDRSMVVLPTGLLALALMAQSRPGVPGRVLEARLERFRALLVSSGAELSRSLTDPVWARQVALDRFLKSKLVEELPGADDVVYRPVAERRVTLEYYKNGVLHRLVPGSLAAACIRAGGQDSFVAEDLVAGFRFQLFLLRYEFALDPAANESVLLQRGLAQLRESGAIEPDGQGWRVIERARVSELAELTANLLESAYLVLRALPQLQHLDLDRKKLAREIQKLGRQFLAVQDLRRPEALSLANLELALKGFAEDGVFTEKTDGGLSIDRDAAGQTLQSLNELMRIKPGSADEERLHT
jgi:glycerol-3-phosphate O-acyltransferase